MKKKNFCVCQLIYYWGKNDLTGVEGKNHPMYSTILPLRTQIRWQKHAPYNADWTITDELIILMTSNERMTDETRSSFSIVTLMSAHRDLRTMNLRFPEENGPVRCEAPSNKPVHNQNV